MLRSLPPHGGESPDIVAGHARRQCLRRNGSRASRPRQARPIQSDKQWRFDNNSNRFRLENDDEHQSNTSGECAEHAARCGRRTGGRYRQLALVTAAKQGASADVQSILSSDGKQEIVATQGGAALILGGLAQRQGDGRSALERRRKPEGGERIRRDGALCGRGLLGSGRDQEASRGRGRSQYGAASGETPLMSAARKGNVDTVRALLDAGANPRRAGKEWRTDGPDVGGSGRLLRGHRGARAAQGRRQRPFQDPEAPR